MNVERRVREVHHKFMQGAIPISTCLAHLTALSPHPPMARRTFCTLFDSHYASRGLALYHSLRQHEKSFQLVIFCFDSKSHILFSKLDLPDIKLVSLQKFETPDLLRIKPTRTRGEYCWTCTPWIIRHCLANLGLSEVTYVDADLYFYQSTQSLFDEFETSKASILLTEHKYTPTFDQSATSGIYCVQFMTFKNSDLGRKALDWWCERCLEWCYDRFEDGKFGDQKYLDDWTTRFEGVHVLNHLGGGVAPWNVQQYNITEGPKINEKEDLIFYHFHKLTWSTDGIFDLCRAEYPLSTEVQSEIYIPYLKALMTAHHQLISVGGSKDLGRSERNLKTRVRELIRRFQGGYYPLKEKALFSRAQL